MTCCNQPCGQAVMQRIPGVYAFTEVSKSGDNLAFNPASGVPVICFICPKCGEIKSYSAKLLKEI